MYYTYTPILYMIHTWSVYTVHALPCALPPCVALSVCICGIIRRGSGSLLYIADIDGATLGRAHILRMPTATYCRYWRLDAMRADYRHIAQAMQTIIKTIIPSIQNQIIWFHLLGIMVAYVVIRRFYYRFPSLVCAVDRLQRSDHIRARLRQYWLDLLYIV